MKLDAVVKAALGEVQKIGGRHGHLRGENGAFDVAAGGLEDEADVLHREGDDAGACATWQMIFRQARGLSMSEMIDRRRSCFF
ncbi:MAG: hypothetical protein WDN28_14195 [Chthoniobacter sp.]